MEMVRMVTTATHAYAGHRLQPGEEYDCEPQHVPVMLKLGWSKPAAAKKRRGKRRDAERESTYQTRVLTAERPMRRRSKGRRT